MHRILVIQLKRIGDFVLTIPALAALRSAQPRAEIVLLVPKNVEELASSVSAVNRVIAFRPGAANLEAWTSAMVGGWDACLDFTGTDRSALLTKLTGARQKIGYAKFSGKGLRRMAYTKCCEANVRELHTVDFHLELVRQLGPILSPGKGTLPALKIRTEARASVAARLAGAGISGPFALVHPGSAREEKFWPADRWAAVIEHLQFKRNLPVVLTGTNEGLEGAHLAALKKHLTGPVADLAGALSLVEVAALVEEARLLVSVDSMAMHVAALFGTPQLALFGPTNPFHWRPRHSRAGVITPGTEKLRIDFQPREPKWAMKDISTQAVIRGIDEILDPSPR